MPRHQTRDLVQPLVVTPGKEINNRFGFYRHDDLVGVPYGSKVGSRNGKGFIHVLRPTPELWTLALPHRMQILYLADIAFVTSWLNIKPGSKVIEAGKPTSALGWPSDSIYHRKTVAHNFAVDGVELHPPVVLSKSSIFSLLPYPVITALSHGTTTGRFPLSEGISYMLTIFLLHLLAY